MKGGGIFCRPHCCLHCCSSGCALWLSLKILLANLLFSSFRPRAPPKEIFKLLIASVWDLFFNPSIRLLTKTASYLHSSMTSFSIFSSRSSARILSTSPLIESEIFVITYISLIYAFMIRVTVLSQNA